MSFHETNTCRWSNRGVTQSLVRNLPALATIFIIVTMVVTVLGSAVLFTYKVGVEGKDAVITLKTHVQSSQYGSSMRLSQWLEDNQIPQYIDQHMTNAYENLLQKVAYLAFNFYYQFKSLLSLNPFCLPIQDFHKSKSSHILYRHTLDRT